MPSGAGEDAIFEPKDTTGAPARRPRGTLGHAPVTPGLCYYLRLFIILRWFAAGGTLLAIALFQFVIGCQFPYPWLYAIALGIVAYNVGFHFYASRFCWSGGGDDETQEERQMNAVNRVVALLQINMDLVALFALLHFSGGLENPAVLFFVFHVVIASILLAPYLALAEACFASLLIFTLGVIERLEIVEHYHAEELLGGWELANSWLYVLGLSTAMTVTLVFVAGFSAVIMRERRRRRDQILTLSAVLRAKNDELLRVDEGRRGLLTVASHDLKSPIAAVAGYLMTLREGYLGDVDDRQVAVLDKCLKRLDGLKTFVSDVLSWTAVESGQLRMDMRRIDLAPLVEQVVEYYRDRADEKQIALVLERDDALPEVEATPERMVQVFENLLSNAVKYTPEGGRITVRIIGAGGVRVEVSDTGIGMSEADQEHLFEGFFRAKAVKTQYEGTGLGLSLSRGIVEAHGGQIEVQSQLGQGTTVTVDLPGRAPRPMDVDQITVS